MGSSALACLKTTSLAVDLPLLFCMQDVRMRLTVDPVSGHVSVLLEPTTPGSASRPSSPIAGQPQPALSCHCRLWLVVLLGQSAGLPQQADELLSACSAPTTCDQEIQGRDLGGTASLSDLGHVQLLAQCFPAQRGRLESRVNCR